MQRALALQASLLAQGLFARVVAMSGSAFGGMLGSFQTLGNCMYREG